MLISRLKILVHLLNKFLLVCVKIIKSVFNLSLTYFKNICNDNLYGLSNQILMFSGFFNFGDLIYEAQTRSY